MPNPPALHNMLRTIRKRLLPEEYMGRTEEPKSHAICMVRPAFSWHFTQARPHFGQSHSESRASSVRLTARLNNKNSYACEEINFLYLYHVGHFNVDFKCSYTLTRTYICTYFLANNNNDRNAKYCKAGNSVTVSLERSGVPVYHTNGSQHQNKIPLGPPNMVHASIRPKGSSFGHVFTNTLHVSEAIDLTGTLQ